MAGCWPRRSRCDRTWPVEGGNVSFSRTDHAARRAAQARTRRSSAALRWSGMFELELHRTRGRCARCHRLQPARVRVDGAGDRRRRAAARDLVATGSVRVGPDLACDRARRGPIPMGDADARHVLWRARNGGGRRALRALWPGPGSPTLLPAAGSAAGAGPSPVRGSDRPRAPGSAWYVGRGRLRVVAVAQDLGDRQREDLEVHAKRPFLDVMVVHSTLSAIEV